jgi:nitrogen-specific signal transduction histidine kinase
VLIYENVEDLQNHLDRLNDFGTQYNKDRLITNIATFGDQLKQVEEFKYLVSMLTYNKQASSRN